jgi:hypothetical protein
MHLQRFFPLALREGRFSWPSDGVLLCACDARTFSRITLWRLDVVSGSARQRWMEHGPAKPL